MQPAAAVRGVNTVFFSTEAESCRDAGESGGESAGRNGQQRMYGFTSDAAPVYKSFNTQTNRQTLTASC